MRKVALALSLVICGSIASAQTLTELAKKEKDRRKANEKSGKEAVVEVTFGVSPRNTDLMDLPSCREAKRLQAVVRDMRRNR
jgi:hypothetical protein